MSFSLASTVADSTVFSFPKATEQIPNRGIPKHRIFPIQAQLFGKIHADLFIVQPLQVDIEQDEDDTYVVSDDLFLVYGNGINRPDAINDYIKSLAEFYQLVKKNALASSFDQDLLNHLQTYIQPEPLRGYDAIQTDRD